MQHPRYTEAWWQEQLQIAEKLLAEVADIEDDSQGEFDAAEDIRRMREERLEQLCQSDVSEIR